MPLFANWGQVLQLIVALAALGFAAHNAFPSMAANNFFSAGSIIFYLLVALVLVSLWVVLKPTLASGQKAKVDTEAGEQGRWFAPLLYGGVAAIGLYALFIVVGAPYRQEHLLQAQNEPSGLTDEQIQRLKLTFLRLPRPCIVKVTAAPEHMDLRKGFLELASAQLDPIPVVDEPIIRSCQLHEDEKDQHPELYREEINSMPRGVIVVNGFDAVAVKILVDEIRETTGLRVRSGKDMLSGSSGNWTRIQIGAGTLR